MDVRWLVSLDVPVSVVDTVDVWFVSLLTAELLAVSVALVVEAPVISLPEPVEVVELVAVSVRLVVAVWFVSVSFVVAVEALESVSV